MLTWLHDLKYSLTSLLGRPALTATSVLSLAIGLGGALAIFAAAHAVLFRPLPFSDPGQLVALEAMVQRDTLEARAFSVPDFLDYREGVASVVTMAAWDTTTMTLRDDGPGLRLPGESVGSNYFELLGVSPVLGATLPDRETTDETPALLISAGVWNQLFSADPGIIGRTVLADERPFVIVGVLPAWFRGVTGTADTWLPFAPPLIPASTWARRGSRWHGAIGRLAPVRPQASRWY